MGSQFDLACKLNLTYYFWVCLVYIFLLLLSSYVFFFCLFRLYEFFMYGFFQSSPFTFPVVHPLKVNGPWKVYYPQNRNPGYSVNYIMYM